MLNNRDVTLDYIKGIGIILMIIGHSDFAFLYDGLLRHFIYSFHMPLFFLCSGYLYKRRDVSDAAKRLSLTSLYPYFIFSIIWLVLSMMYGTRTFLQGVEDVLWASNNEKSRMFLSTTTAIGSIWFLFAFFWGKVCFNYIESKTKKYVIVSFFISALAVLIERYVNLPMSFLQGVSSTIFIAIGYYYKENRVNIYFVLICIVAWLFCLKYSYIELGSCSYGIYPLDVLGACGGTILCYYIAKFMQKAKCTNAIAICGKYSLQLLCFHFLITYLMERLSYGIIDPKLHSILFVILPFVVLGLYLIVPAMKWLFIIPIKK